MSATTPACTLARTLASTSAVRQRPQYPLVALQVAEGNPLPSVLHASLSEAQLGSGQVVIVGDIHGCCNEFLTLVEQCEYQQGRDSLILVGDLVNKGPHSQQVLEEARRLGAYAVRGNHDEAALKAQRALKNGLTVRERYAWAGDLTPDNVAYLQDLPFTLSLPSRHIVVVHAGLLPGVPLEQQSPEHMVKMRDVVPHLLGNESAAAGWLAAEKPQPNGYAWASKWPGPQHVFFGHDAKRRLQLHPHATGLDTGCCYGGTLTACVLPPAGAAPDHSHSVCNPVTLDSLGGRLVSVPAATAYSKVPEA